MKKDTIIQSSEIITGSSLLGYLGYLFYLNINITPDYWLNYNLVIYIVFAVFSLMILLSGICVFCLERTKTIHTCFGIILILSAHYLLLDQPDKGNVIADIIKIIGVIITIISPMGWTMPDQCKKQIAKAKQIIIEV